MDDQVHKEIVAAIAAAKIVIGGDPQRELEGPESWI
jgi:hypothetical protein